MRHGDARNRQPAGKLRWQSVAECQIKRRRKTRPRVRDVDGVIYRIARVARGGDGLGDVEIRLDEGDVHRVARDRPKRIARHIELRTVWQHGV